VKTYATVKGLTTSGMKFRPSTWTEMLLSPTATGCKITICNGIKCIDVDLDCLEAERIMNFARDNDLVVDSPLPLE
jgi:hypothetical protein